MDVLARPKRGLSALLASTTNPESDLETSPSSITTADLPITAIRPNANQPRTHFDEEALAELAASIKARGLIQPVVVRQLKPEEANNGQHYELIAGERRWRAAQIAGLPVVSAVIKEVFDDREILLLSLVENLQRDDLNPIEEALAYDRLSKVFGLTHEEVAEGVGRSRAAVTNMIRLLELPTSVQDALKSKKLSTGHAKVLLSIPDARIQAQLAAKIQAEGLTVRELERLILSAQPQSPGVPLTVNSANSKRQPRVVPPHVQDVERRLREHLGTRVTVEENIRKGRIIIEFYSVEDFGRVTKLLGVE